MSQKSLTSFLFDMDGTLVDSAAGLAGAVNDVRASFGFPPLPAADFREAASEGSAALLRVKELRDTWKESWLPAACLVSREE